MRAAVLGSPIEHSLSPLLHNAAYESLGIDGNYTRFEVQSGQLAPFLSEHSGSEWRGFSLTMPLKEEVLALADWVEPAATRISSANTLIWDEESWKAFSTDLRAFKRIVEQGIQASPRRVAILGAGGTARAALGALDGLVSHVDVLVRQPSRNAQMAAAAKFTEVHFLPLETPLVGYNLVIATLPSGASDSLASQISAGDGLLIEALYSPWPTELVRRWKSVGGKVISGFQLLVEQALDQISLMAERDFDFDQMREHLFEVLAKERPESRI